MRVDQRPKLKARGGPYFYTWVAVSAFYREYLRNPVRMRLEVGERRARGGHRAGPELRPVHLLRPPPGARLRGRSRSTTARSRSRSCAAPRSATWRRSSPASSTERLRASRHRQIDHFDDVTEARVELGLDRSGRRPAPVPGPGRRRLHRRPRRARARHRPGRANGRCLTATASSARSLAGEAEAEIVFEDERLARLPRLPAAVSRPLAAGPARAPRDARRPAGRAGRALLRQRAAALGRAIRDAMGAAGLVRRDQQRRLPERARTCTSTSSRGCARTACAGSSGRGRSTRATSTAETAARSATRSRAALAP